MRRTTWGRYSFSFSIVSPTIQNWNILNLKWFKTEKNVKYEGEKSWNQRNISYILPKILLFQLEICIFRHIYWTEIHWSRCPALTESCIHSPVMYLCRVRAGILKMKPVNMLLWLESKEKNMPINIKHLIMSIEFAFINTLIPSWGQ